MIEGCDGSSGLSPGFAGFVACEGGHHGEYRGRIPAESTLY